MNDRHDIQIVRYDERTKAGLFDLYYAVACQRNGIARQPEEVTHDYVNGFFENATRSGVGYSAVNQQGDLVGDIHAEFPSIQIFRGMLWNLTIAIHPDYQGRGIGRLLFEALIDEARARGDVHRIELYCRETNARGIKLYKSLGFEIEGTLRQRTNVDGRFENDLVMGLLLKNDESARRSGSSKPVEP